MEKMMTCAEVAEKLNVNPQTVRRWARDGVLACSRPINRGSGRYHFKKEDVEKYINRSRVDSASRA